MVVTKFGRVELAEGEIPRQIVKLMQILFYFHIGTPNRGIAEREVGYVKNADKFVKGVSSSI